MCACVFPGPRCPENPVSNMVCSPPSPPSRLFCRSRRGPTAVPLSDTEVDTSSDGSDDGSPSVDEFSVDGDALRRPLVAAGDDDHGRQPPQWQTVSRPYASGPSFNMHSPPLPCRVRSTDERATKAATAAAGRFAAEQRQFVRRGVGGGHQRRPGLGMGRPVIEPPENIVHFYNDTHRQQRSTRPPKRFFFFFSEHRLGHLLTQARQHIIKDGDQRLTFWHCR